MLDRTMGTEVMCLEMWLNVGTFEHLIEHSGVVKGGKVLELVVKYFALWRWVWNIKCVARFGGNKYTCAVDSWTYSAKFVFNHVILRKVPSTITIAN